MPRIIIALVFTSLAFGQSATQRNPNYWRSCTDSVTTNCSPRTDASGNLNVTGKLYSNGIEVGASGPAGPAGPVGPAGPTGADGAPGVPGYSPNTLLSGGGVTWTSGLVFRVSAATYLIGNAQVTSDETDVTLTADASQARIDVIAVDDSGAVVLIEGTPAESPVKPSVDPATQLELSFVSVAASATEPTNVTSTLVYAEGAGGEWTASASGAGFTVGSTSNPHGGTKDVEATAVTTGQYAQFQAAAPVDLSTANTLSFYIRSKAAWSSKRSVQIYFASTGTRVGSIVTLNEGAFGFSSSNTSTYQLVVVPLSLFAATGTVNQLRFAVAGTNTAIGFYLDDISIQGGLANATAPSAMNWRGTYSASAAYSVNDVVSSGGATYVARAASTNSAPNGSTNANWSPLATKTSVLQAVVFDFATDTATGDGKYYIYVDSSLNGMNLTAVNAQVVTAGTTGTTDVQIARCAAAASGSACSGTVTDMLTTKLTVDSGENSSSTAATAAVIDTSNDDVATGQVLRIDVDAVSTTAAKGLIVTLTFQLP